MVVEDDVPTRIGLRTILDAEPDSAVVGEADNGVEACALAVDAAPDVVLMDVQMQELDGTEACGRRKLDRVADLDVCWLGSSPTKVSVVSVCVRSVLSDRRAANTPAHVS